MRASSILFVVLAAVAFAAAGDAGTPAPADLIVFSSTRGENVGNQEIYSVRLNGTRRRDLSRSQGLDAFPSVSPNRKLIAYESIEPQPRLGRELIALKVMRPDGTGKRVLTPPSLQVDPDSTPAWSPDGSKLAFYASGGGADAGVYVVRVDGTGLRLLAPNATQPAWEPNGNRIAFVKFEGGPIPHQGIGVVNADGRGESLLTSDYFDGLPAWSPAGGTLAFVRGGSLQFSLWTVSADGGEPNLVTGSSSETIESIAWLSAKRLVYSGSSVWSVATSGTTQPQRLAFGGFPTPSPDGRRIAYLGDNSIRVMTASGGNRRVVLRLPSEFAYGAPRWSPAGGLVFTSAKYSTKYDLWTVRASGGHLRQLTDSRAHERYPQWSPDRGRLVFVRTSDLSETDPQVWVSDANAKNARRIARGTYPTWSPDGDRIAFSHGTNVYVVAAKGGRSRRLVQGTGPAWSPNGRVIAFVRGSEAFVVDLPSRHVRSLIDLNPLLSCEDVGATVAPPEWSPNGRRLLVVGLCDRGRTASGGGFFVRADGTLEGAFPADSMTSSRPAWSPAGARIAYLSTDWSSSIVTSKLDGSARRVATWSSADDRDLDW